MSTENKLLSSVAYLSVFFLPVIMPIIILVIASKPEYSESRSNAIQALWLHIAPWLMGVVAAILLIAGGTGVASNGHVPAWPIILFVLVGIIGIAVIFLLCYNIYRGIKVLVD
ncbi:DUF4870 domain-containing protein [Pediococcus claussenii]|uniref:Membrane protein n=1 Tax=Pediococcus claussenii (strain ATCC BAA-344 / DSM 14800 / JCM 18046 / KCTC 3811 / LMG 21948 / P06) TaxID=701521 RepID=G8PA56_PEDCP|nr:DUF4870 domain-containing protein [Pediococcus claussenii]AEV94495.1 putative membrane protein [Pediococcus claussenii ATCC BAA-344]ANZ69712.1 hypothetical protein AYR57_05005 [Pediococcus claussenii]ANZ71529.1 hypothetical protein AYR58_05010 [Pediococcus claussenii]KRN19799.1 hypothetical protein IV79_GL001087 [Pediococcus claussenii]